MPAGQALLHKSAKATLRFKCRVAAVLWPVETPEWISYVLSSIPEYQNVLLQFRFFFHIGLEYLFTLWTCYMLYTEYDYVASMRLQFLASQRRHAEQFTVVVRSIPPSLVAQYQKLWTTSFKRTTGVIIFVIRKQWQKTMGQTAEPDLNLKSYLADAYLHPIFRSFEEQELVEVSVDKHQTLAATPITSELSSHSPPHYARQTPPSPPESAHYQSSPPQL
ncbi:PREDICTED: CSC1 [Prunus dulcis]|uniref:PREDICTED: CSC1 n=1 Tax=Prunus dulcis TaxID=3755 RepID=A0A5E4G0H8_PRUDU|nr:PREDICTED: CSC1 [Prunus dulcis]